MFVGALSASLSCFASSIIAASDSTQIKTHVNNLTSISCDSTAQRCLAVGFMLKKNGNWFDKHSINHVVYATQDGGNTWNEPLTLRHPSNMTINGTMNIHCDDSGLTCLIAGTANVSADQDDIIVYTTDDAGLHWNKLKRLNIPEDKGTNIIGMSCSNKGDKCHILAQNGPLYSATIYKTQDAGQTWSSISLPKPENANGTYRVDGISCSDSSLRCTIIGGTEFDEQGSGSLAPLSYTTQDSGLTWSITTVHDQLSTDHSEKDYFSHIKCDNTGLKCIALRYQEIHEPPVITYVHAYTTLDGGISWQKIGSIDNFDGSIYESFSAFDCDKAGQFCIAVYSPIGVEGASPLVYATHDGGATWRNEDINTPEETSILLDVFCDDNALLCQIVGMRDPFRNSEKLQKLLSH